MIMGEQVLVAKSEQLHGIVDELLGIVAEAVQQQTPIHQVEKKTFETLLRAESS